jgi:hypothetical protein
MATRFTGLQAIEMAKKIGCLVHARARGDEPAREDLTADEARLIALDDPTRIYLDIDEIGGGGRQTA